LEDSNLFSRHDITFSQHMDANYTERRNLTLEIFMKQIGKDCSNSMYHLTLKKIVSVKRLK